MERTRIGKLLRPGSLCANRHESVWWTEQIAALQDWREAHLEQHAFAMITRTLMSGSLIVTDVRRLMVGEDQAAPTAIVWGAHGMCDIGHLSHASLRHAVVLLWPMADDESGAMEVIDLRSASGLTTRPDTGAERLLANDVIRLAMGANEVTLIHASPGSRFPADFPDEMDGLSTLTQSELRKKSRAPLHAVPTGRPYVKRDASSPHREKTKTGAVVYRDQGGFRRRYASHPLPEDPVIVSCSEEDLRRGLLLGRYRRCDGANELIRSDKVSRVHAMLVTRRGRTWLIDVGSTNGTDVFALGQHQVVAELDARQRVWPVGPSEGFRLGGLEVLIEVRA